MPPMQHCPVFAPTTKHGSSSYEFLVGWPTPSHLPSPGTHCNQHCVLQIEGDDGGGYTGHRSTEVVPGKGKNWC